MKWTDEKTALLRKLRAQGIRAREIAKRLGVTPNAVIQKARRLKLSRNSENPRQRKATMQPKQKTLAAGKSVVKQVLRLQRGDCRWPHGDPLTPDFRFCGAKAVRGRPYCAKHATVAYVPLVPRPRGRKRRQHVSPFDYVVDWYSA